MTFSSTPWGRRMIACAAAVAITAAAMTVADDHEERASAHTAAPAAQQPFFDEFNGRDYWYADFYGTGKDLFPLERTYFTGGATLEPGESAPCGQNVGATVWVEYYADRSGTLHLAADGDGFDAFVAVYTWDLSGELLPSPPGAKLQPAACAAQGTPNQGLSFAITRDTQYLIQVGGQNGGSGSVVVTAACDCAPANDGFDRLHDVYLDEHQPEAVRTANTARATLEAVEQRPCGNIGATVWYTVYATNPIDIELTTAGSDFDTVIAVYGYPDYDWSAASVKPLECVDAGANGSPQASLTLDATASTQYFIQIGGANGATGNLQFAARCVPSCPPYNDSVNNAIYLEPPVEEWIVPTEGATTEPGEPRPCGDMGSTVWFTITTRGDARLALDLSGSDFDTVIAVYESVFFSPPPGSFDLIDCESGSGLQFDVKANQTYWIQVGGVDGATGRLTMNADCTPAPCPPFNDSIVQPYYFWRPYGDQEFVEFFDLRGATTEPGEPRGCGDMEHSAWWAIDLYAPQPLTRFVFDTALSDFDTAIAIYETELYGNSLNTDDVFGQLDAVSCVAGGAGERVRATFTAFEGKRYYVQIGGRAGQSGQLRVALACEGPCPPENDNVGGAWYTAYGYATTVDTRGATLEADEETPCGNIGKTVWFRIDGLQTAGEIRVSTAGSDFPTVISLYAVEGVSPPGGVRNVACAAGSAISYDAAAGTAYLLQVGGVDGAAGALSVRIDCDADACGSFLPAQGGGGVLFGPDTGSGGYKPGARQ